MAFARDPLSEQYDAEIGPWLDALWGQTPRGGYIYSIADVPSPAGDPDDGTGLTVHERAWVRAMYYNVKRREPAKSLRITWGEALVRPDGIIRAVAIQLFAKSSGQRYAERLGTAGSYVQNPGIQPYAQYNV